MTTLAAPPGEKIQGAGVLGNSLYTWGSSLLSWDMQTGRTRAVLPRRRAPFERGGCVFRDGFILQEAGSLVWFSDGRGVVLETEIDTPDVLPATLFGRRGVLVVQKYSQVRFYELASGHARDIYSFYTPSRQAGLLLHDVDGDGRPDLFCGNYWIRSPKAFELPWRLFAINTWTETVDSATVRLGIGRAGAKWRLICCQAEMRDARVAVFEPPSDLTQLWPGTAVSGDLGLTLVRGLAIADFNGDGVDEIAISEDAGPGSRVMIHDGAWRPLATTEGVHTLASHGKRLIGVGARAVTLWDREDMRRLLPSSPRGKERTGL